MAEDLMAYLDTVQPAGFKPIPYYGAQEDSLTYYFDEAESYGRRVDDLVTLFLSVEDDKLVGFQVKGIRKRLNELGNLGFSIKQGKVRLDLAFAFLAVLEDRPFQKERYFDFSQRTKNIELELVGV